MKIAPHVLAVASSLLLLASATSRAVDYAPFNYSGPGATVITGIRGASAIDGDAVITGSLSIPDSGGNTQAIIYEGSIYSQNGTWTPLTPTISGQTITTSTLYGPNTGYYDPSLGVNGIRAVGSYKYSTGGSYDHGLMYTRIGGVETWSQFDMPDSVAGGTVLYTIAHSTMGSLVVGNYDTQLDEGHAFVYDLNTSTFRNFLPVVQGIAFDSITAYGIWKNANGTYTIAGGYSNLANNVLDAGYLVDYDPSQSGSDAYTHFTSFQYDNQPLASLISHFDGIVATEDGYNLTGDHATLADPQNQLGFFAQVTRNEDGSFNTTADWISIEYPGNAITSGNTVYGDSVLGVSTGSTTTSYIATVPEPSSLALLGLASLTALATIRRRHA
ncbi:hypothetical protein DB345_02750 [Spartobacteria bacterium LR76]|nr:hypothetical protein DB345_02750 [Spartobacteria bacterium LR76]